MDKLKELLDRIPYGLLVVAILGWTGWSYYKFSSGNDSERAAKQTELDNVKKETDAIEAKIKAANEFYRSLDQKRIELRALAQQLDEMRGNLTEQLDVAYLVKMIVTEATKVGLSVQGIKPTTSKVSEYYAEQTFELSYRAVYVQLLVFIERLSTVERIVRIESLDSKAVGSTDAPYVEIAGNIQLKAYKYIGSKADQLGKPDEGGAPAGTSGAAPKKTGGG